MIRRVSCVSAVRRFTLLPDTHGLYENARFVDSTRGTLALTSHDKTSCGLRKILGNVRTNTTVWRVSMSFNLISLYHSKVSWMLSTDINITETTFSCQF
jgi:hypothetical protein